MKVIFLDMDGVLNCGAFLYSDYVKGDRSVPHGESWLSMIDPAAVARLNAIVQATNAEVVLSSSWRVQFKNVDDLTALLVQRGFKTKLLDRTCTGGEMPASFRGGRGVEVAEWLSRHKDVSSFVILDDCDDFAGIEDRLILTEWGSHDGSIQGLLDHHADKAIRMLGAECLGCREPIDEWRDLFCLDCIGSSSREIELAEAVSPHAIYALVDLIDRNPLSDEVIAEALKGDPQ